MAKGKFVSYLRVSTDKQGRSDWDLRADRDRGAAGAASWRGRQDAGMEEQGIAASLR
jgi:hypothetical protein